MGNNLLNLDVSQQLMNDRPSITVKKTTPMNSIERHNKFLQKKKKMDERNRKWQMKIVDKHNLSKKHEREKSEILKNLNITLSKSELNKAISLPKL